MKQYQFVRWFPEWVGFSFCRLDKKETDLAYIFEWFLAIGFWEIRKWNNELEVDK